MATITSGTWNIRGSRYFIPNNGAGVKVSSFLSNGKIFIGDSSNIPAEQSISGDISITSSGVTSINPAVIVDSYISPTANISVQKLEAKTPDKIAVYDSNGKLIASGVDANLLPYLTGLTGNIQDQIDNAATNITGAITTFVSVDATPDRVIVSDPSGKLSASTVSVTQLQTATIPTGLIAIWSGTVASIPGGWQLCDGTNGTRDLRSLFVVGAGGSYNVGDTGGAAQFTLTVSQMPSHSHTINDPGHTHTNGSFNRLMTVNGTGTATGTEQYPRRT